MKRAGIRDLAIIAALTSATVAIAGQWRMRDDISWMGAKQTPSTLTLQAGAKSMTGYLTVESTHGTWLDTAVLRGLWRGLGAALSA